MTLQKILTYLGYGVAAASAFWLTVPDAIHYLVFAMGLDIVTGFLCAVTTKQVNSSAAWSGVSKKVATLILISLVYVGGHMMNIGFAPQLVDAVTGFYIYTEVVSIFENATILGVPIPDFLKNALLELNPEKKTAAQSQGIGLPRVVSAPVPDDPGSDAIQTMKGE